MQQKLDFVYMVKAKSLSFSELCRRFNISRPTGYKWLNRFEEFGLDGLTVRSRRPNGSPFKTIDEVEEIIVKLRNEDPEWGPKKLHRLLVLLQAKNEYPNVRIPSVSTIGNILKRNGLIRSEKSRNAEPMKRFEYDQPNELWQMDYKGEFLMRNNSYCYPLTVTDDHSRFSLILKACKNQRYYTVMDHLTSAFKRYGMPAMILCDNASPWGLAGQNPAGEGQRVTKLEKWMIRLNINLIHGRPYHPQTQGKEERFHRTLKTELLNYSSMKDFNHCQYEFDKWRMKYNYKRPHEALSFDVPAQRYKPSVRKFPDRLPEFEFHSGDIIRKADENGKIRYKSKIYRVGRAFSKDLLALRPTDQKSILDVYYFNKLIRKIYL